MKRSFFLSFVFALLLLIGGSAQATLLDISYQMTTLNAYVYPDRLGCLFDCNWNLTDPTSISVGSPSSYWGTAGIDLTTSTASLQTHSQLFNYGSANATIEFRPTGASHLTISAFAQSLGEASSTVALIDLTTNTELLFLSAISVIINGNDVSASYDPSNLQNQVNGLLFLVNPSHTYQLSLTSTQYYDNANNWATLSLTTPLPPTVLLLAPAVAGLLMLKRRRDMLQRL